MTEHDKHLADVLDNEVDQEKEANKILEQSKKDYQDNMEKED
ncbi:MAG: hypothetical protein U1E54_03390 [Candidatus Levybacteria bacterium]|nr:hypothetical protein [Candidatus Levybacteria bacterium]